jgi:hypothetical protein
MVGVAQAQSMPRHDGIVIPTAAAAKPNTAARPADDTCTQIVADGVNIRRTPWGTVIGTANHTDLVSNPIDYATEPDGSYWKELVDYSDGNVLGWVIGTYVTEGIPADECP